MSKQEQQEQQQPTRYSRSCHETTAEMRCSKSSDMTDVNNTISNTNDSTNGYIKQHNQHHQQQQQQHQQQQQQQQQHHQQQQQQHHQQQQQQHHQQQQQQHHQQQQQHHHARPIPIHQPSRRLRLRMQALVRSRPSLAHKLQQMALPLSPLVQLPTGAIHAHFPATVLHFWLLTDAQLESLACFYHQHRRTRGPWSVHYPCPVSWRSDLPLEEKRRRMGRFIGLRGCNRPDARYAARARHIESIEAVVAEAAAAAASTAVTPVTAMSPAASTAASTPTSTPTSTTIPSEDEITRQIRLAAAATAHDHSRQRKLNPW